ncbi:MAG: response regulator [Desulfatitalea sp.]
MIEFNEPKVTIVTGKETVLFVDDEEGIVEIGRLILEKMGYKVIEAHGGREAIAIFRKKKEKIDIVILDMIMPGMGGGETFGELKEIDPHIKVLLSSGYSINGQAQGIMDRGCDGFIQKPFNMQDLSIKVRKVLDGRDGSSGS